MLKIIVSPAKKMNMIDEYNCEITSPVFMEYTKHLHSILKDMPREMLKSLWQCSDKLTDQNYDRLQTYSLENNRTPALLAYEGIQYQYMAPHIFTDSQWDYAAEHLRILSGFYGILKPTDGVIPYRLEMQARLKTEHTKDLYGFWEDRLYTELVQDDNTQLLNLASAEYSKAVLPYIKPPVTYVSCTFGEEIDGKIKVKGTQAKIARGEMVRWMAEHQVEKIEDICGFHRLNYRFQPDYSSETEYVFLKLQKEQQPVPLL